MIDSVKRQVKLQVSRRLLKVNRKALQNGPGFPRERLPEELWSCSIDDSGHMRLRDVDLDALAREYSTPVHVVDVEALSNNYEGFLRAFSTDRARVRLATSYKTNPVPYILDKLHEWGSLAEVISHFELWLALRLGLPGDRIIFNGPGKGRESLELAVRSNVRLINVDSIEEMHELETICAAHGRRQDMGIRVTTEVGWQSQFGLSIDNDRAFQGFTMAARSEHLNPVGIHLHLGTGIEDVDTYVSGVKAVVGLARRLQEDRGISIAVFDLGGGFGVPTTRTKTDWDRRLQHLGLPVRTAEPHNAPSVEEYAARIIPIVDAYFDEVDVSDPELIFEPGRAITASAQMLLLSVLRVKTADRSTREVILDGGRNLCAPLSWEFHEIQPVSRMRDTDLYPHNLYGPLCHPHDIIALNKPLPVLQQGDVLAVMDSGAYFIPNQTTFSNPRPGVVALDRGQIRVVRRPESFEDLVACDVLPSPSLDDQPR